MLDGSALLAAGEGVASGPIRTTPTPWPTSPRRCPLCGSFPLIPQVHIWAVPKDVLDRDAQEAPRQHLNQGRSRTTAAREESEACSLPARLPSCRGSPLEQQVPPTQQCSESLVPSLACLSGHEGPIQGLLWHPEAAFVLSMSDDRR